MAEKNKSEGSGLPFFVTVTDADGNELLSCGMEVRQNKTDGKYLTTGFQQFDYQGKRLRGALTLNGWEKGDAVKIEAHKRFRDMVAMGISPKEATDRVKAKYGLDITA